jgi:hypothetical protein
VRSVALADGTPIIADGSVVPGAPDVTVVTNSFTADGGDNYPWLRDNPDKVVLPLNYEQIWLDFLQGLPVGPSGEPTIPASNPDYATPAPGQRITLVP